MRDAVLVTHFEDYNANALVQMASFLGILPEKQRNKTVLIDRILNHISDPKYIRSAVESLSDLERAALDAVLRRDGKAPLRAIRQELGKLRLIDANAKVSFSEYDYQNRPNPNAKASRRLEDVLVRLLLRGLLFSEKTPSTSSYNYQLKRTFYDSMETVYVPGFALPHMPEPHPLPESTYPIKIEEVQESSARVFQRDLYLYWGYVRDHSVGLTLRGEVLKNNLKELVSILQVRETLGKGVNESDLPRTRFVRGALLGLKLIHIHGDHVSVKAAEAFFAASPADRVQSTFEAWRGTDQYNELLLIPAEVRPKSTTNPLVPAKQPLIRAREYVLEQLSRLVKQRGVKNWVAMDNLVDNIYDNNYEFLLKRTTPPTRYYSYSYSVNPYEYTGNEMMLTFPGMYNEQEGWKKVEANLIRGIVTGPLFWMGLVDLGLGKDNAPGAFRLTALGAWVFKQGPKPEIQVEGGKVIVQPNMQVMALDPIQDAVLATLDRFAERLSAERAVEYRLTRSSVYAGQQEGWSAEKIKETLQQFSGAELPGNVARTLEEWQLQFERITIHPRVFLAHGSPQVLDHVTSDRQTSGLVASRPLPEIALLNGSQAITRVAQTLKQRDILPVINSSAVVPPGSVVVSENGDLRFTARVPNLYLHGHLVAFADPVEDGYRITQASVQRAAHGGITAAEILQRLEAVCSAALPEKLVRNIRAWTKHYGSMNLAPVTLLQVRDEATLQELMEDPEVGPLLRKFEPKKTHALARVKPENVQKLKALLAERGVDLADHLE